MIDQKNVFALEIFYQIYNSLLMQI